ncbi:MAG: hypothetical protein CMA91_00210 [Euryarchaeota archaeon]|nr:hypothetical protein [Euryarchaeota archaeon]
MDGMPLLTMTKSRVIDEIPELSEKSTALLHTLSSLCSFHTSEDLASFLFSDMFRELVSAPHPWVIFEIGIYKNHSIVIEAIPIDNGIKLADSSMKGLIPGNVSDISSELECSQILNNWLDGNAHE